MNEAVIRATIKTNTVLNEGFIHIKDDLVEGCFTFDYVKIALTSNLLSLELHERNFCLEDPLKCNTKIKFFSSHCSEKTLFVPYSYTLFSEDHYVLILKLEEIIPNSPDITKILKKIKTVRF